MIAARLLSVPLFAAALAVTWQEARADDAACTRVRSEAVDGQLAELYRVQSKTATGGSDSQIWISTASGLPVRQTVTMLEQGAVKLKHEVRSDYANVRAPADVSR